MYKCGSNFQQNDSSMILIFRQIRTFSMRTMKTLQSVSNSSIDSGAVEDSRTVNWVLDQTLALMYFSIFSFCKGRSYLSLPLYRSLQLKQRLFLVIYIVCPHFLGDEYSGDYDCCKKSDGQNWKKNTCLSCCTHFHLNRRRSWWKADFEIWTLESVLLTRVCYSTLGCFSLSVFLFLCRNSSSHRECL